MRPNERTDEGVTPYSNLYSWLFWPSVQKEITEAEEKVEARGRKQRQKKRQKKKGGGGENHLCPKRWEKDSPHRQRLKGANNFSLFTVVEKKKKEGKKERKRERKKERKKQRKKKRKKEKRFCLFVQFVKWPVLLTRL